MVDVKGGNNMLYLPLDRITQQQSQAGGGVAATPPVGQVPVLERPAMISPDDGRRRDNLREREQR